MFSIQKWMVMTFVAAMTLVGCKDEKDPLVVPTEYDGSAYTEHTVTEYNLRSLFKVFVAELQKGRTEGVALTFENLKLFYAQGNPSLKSITTPYYSALVEANGGYLEELAKSSGSVYLPGVPTGQGGTFNGYLFDENGTEMEQLVDKGLYGAALYHYAWNLMQTEVGSAEADQLLAIFGAHPSFPNTPTASKTLNPDVNMANYAARRDKNNGLGLYSQMKNAFLRLQAAVQAGAEYNEERDQALADIRLLWEKINYATVVNYCHNVISLLSATNPSAVDQAKALHALGECIGFVHGWRGLPNGAKQFTDAEIDELLSLLNNPVGGESSTYLFVTDPVNELGQLTQLIQKVQTKFGFTDQEIDDFKINWVSAQGR
jgi:hypothetical protein